MLIALANGDCQKEAAVRLGVSPVTIHRQIASVYDKAGGGPLVRVLALMGWLHVPDE